MSQLSTKPVVRRVPDWPLCLFLGLLGIYADIGAQVGVKVGQRATLPCKRVHLPEHGEYAETGVPPGAEGTVQICHYFNLSDVFASMHVHA